MAAKQAHPPKLHYIIEFVLKTCPLKLRDLQHFLFGWEACSVLDLTDKYIVVIRP